MFSCGQKSHPRAQTRPQQPLSTGPLQPRQPCIEPLVKVFQSVIFLEQKTLITIKSVKSVKSVKSMKSIKNIENEMDSTVSCDTCNNCSLCNPDEEESFSESLQELFYLEFFEKFDKNGDEKVGKHVDVKVDKNVQCDEASIYLATTRQRPSLIVSPKNLNLKTGKRFISKSAPSLL